MKIIEQGHKWVDSPNRGDAFHRIELAARNCYKSEDDKKKSASELIRDLLKKGHESVIEHVNATIRLVTDRGVSHELVRHRLATYSQESTRYCNYSKGRFGGEITLIAPVWYPVNMLTAINDKSIPETWKEETSSLETSFLFRMKRWVACCAKAETEYMQMLAAGATPQEARAILPNSLKTEVIMTANMREWRHILRLRTSAAAHPQIRDLFQPVLSDMDRMYPELFEDIAGNS